MQGAYLSANADNVFKDIKDMMDGFNKRFKAVEEYMSNFPEFDKVKKEESKEKKASQKMTEITSDKDFIFVKLHLGDLDSNKIDIEVDGDSMKGSVPISDGQANFYVQNGRMFGLSFKKEIKKEEKTGKDDENSAHIAQSISVSASTKVESLPDQVCDLEKMVANYKDGILELKLPRVPQKKGTKINVAPGI